MISRPSRPSASSASRSVSAISDSGIPNSRSISWRSSTAPADRRAERLGRDRGGPHRLQLARRPGQHDDRRAAALAAAPPARARCRPARAPSRPRARPPACGWSRIASGSSSGQRDISGRGSRRCAPPAPRRAPSARPWKSPDDLRGEVVGGRPQAAAGDDDVDARARPGSAAPRRMSSRRSPTISDVARGRRRPRAGARPATARCGRSTRPVRTSVPVTTMPARALTRSGSAAIARKAGGAPCSA